MFLAAFRRSNTPRRQQRKDRLNAEHLEPRLMLVGESLNPHVLDRGDFNDDGRLDIADIDALSTAVDGQSLDPRFDANRDGVVDNSDRLFWVQDLRKTYFGDTNLDGEFTSADLVLSFQGGHYVDGIGKNASWSNGGCRR